MWYHQLRTWFNGFLSFLLFFSKAKISTNGFFVAVFLLEMFACSVWVIEFQIVQFVRFSCSGSGESWCVCSGGPAFCYVLLVFVTVKRQHNVNAGSISNQYASEPKVDPLILQKIPEMVNNKHFMLVWCHFLDQWFVYFWILCRKLTKWRDERNNVNSLLTFLTVALYQLVVIEHVNEAFFGTVELHFWFVEEWKIFNYCPNGALWTL